MKGFYLGCFVWLLAVNAAASSEPTTISSNWRHVIHSDPIDDSVSCAVTAGAVGEEYPPAIIYSQDASGGYVTAIGEKHPGREVAFRVDRHPPVSGEEGVVGPGYNQLYGQIMEGGKTLTYKVIEWPSGLPRYMRIDLSGAADHILFCVLAVNGAPR